MLTLHTLPDPVLRQKALPVAAVDAHVIKLMREMLETMYADNGIGLAANQVGILERIVTIDVSGDRDGTEAMLMVNPEILETSEETFTYHEGCLSVPDYYADVARPKRIRFAYLDQHGVRQEMQGEDLLSQCVQHEIDHLNGVLFIDHLSMLKRQMILRKIDKAQKEKDKSKVL